MGHPAVLADEPVRQLYEAYGPAVRNYLVRLTGGDRHRAEDVMQETFIRAWRHPEARRADGQWSRPWLFTVARRIAIDHVRAALARPCELGDHRLDDRQTVDDDYERLVERHEVLAALEDLPERLRGVLVEVYFHDRSVAETAQALGIAAGTVKSRTFYGLRALREALIDRGYLPGPA